MQSHQFRLVILMMSSNLRSQVVQLYKNLYFMGKEYPRGSVYFHEKLKNAFLKNKDVTDPKQVELLITRGEFVLKELEALYMLRKYRTLKKRYYEEERSTKKVDETS